MHFDKKRIFMMMIITITMCLVGYELHLICNINQKIDQLSFVENSEQQLRDSEYYQENLIDLTAIDALFDKQSDSLLYIHSADCPACYITDEYLSLFIELGYHHEMDIYFIDISSLDDIKTINSALANWNIELQVTPTLYLIKANKLSIQAEGADDIYDILNNIVESVSAQA